MDNEKSRQVYQLADTTFRNMEDLMKDMSSLASSAKVLHKNLLGALEASEAFYALLNAVGSKATHLPGGVKKLGEALVEISSAQKLTNQALIGWLGSLFSDFILPLELKVNNEAKKYTNLRKSYKHDCAKKEHNIDKINDSLKDYRKKEKRGSLQMSLVSAKDRHNLDRFADESAELDTLRTEGLRKALTEESKLYCFLLEHMCQSTHHQVTYYTQGHSNLSQRLLEWGALCSDPNNLPPESAVLLVDPLSPQAFQRSPSPEQPQRKNIPEGRITLSRDSETLSNGQTSKSRENSNSSLSDTHRSDLDTSELVTRKKECMVRARFDFKATSSCQLSFKEGDAIETITESKDGWQFGKNSKTGETGWFPLSYVLNEEAFLTSPRKMTHPFDPNQAASMMGMSNRVVEMDPSTHPAIRRDLRSRNASGGSNQVQVENMMSPERIVSPPVTHSSYGTPSVPAGLLPAPITPPPTGTPPKPPDHSGDSSPSVQSV